MPPASSSSCPLAVRNLNLCSGAFLRDCPLLGHHARCGAGVKVHFQPSFVYRWLVKGYGGAGEG
eukprot:1867816-Amphidinium_carterae.1